MYFIWITVASFTFANCIATDGTLVNVNKYCRDRDRLITSEENDEYLLVSAENRTTVILACRYCNERDESESKIWYYQDRYRETSEKEVELDTNNNVSYSRVYTTPEFGLVIKNFSSVTDAGIYRCHGKDGQEEENKYNYRIEPILKDIGGEFVEEGNITEWEKYHETYLLPVTMRFAVSQMMDLARIREEGVILQVISEWGPWGPCKQCVYYRGIKTSRGYCRLKRNINSTMAQRNDSLVIRFFRISPKLPCKYNSRSVHLMSIIVFAGILRRCVSCRSRGELGSCKDPFTMNSTQIAVEKGVDAVPCVSGWCGKIIESQNLNNEYGIATQRLCFQRGPDDNEERCAYTVWNYKKVYMCLCHGDLCNGTTTTVANGFLMTIIVYLMQWLV
ncbi:uncharacterized protein LOC109855564 isoform X3 [Pseudomyrmex gracilis]|uniref:uncharacterized protein LOC109855564 isoform X3 n=1 Tax=Pseudomyrmex gracilis TaxID=219809 RepID=UPI000994992F|nr:uncharacterized protein LOC109855564 isoform X3 [Pseudomyrmex gracilis]